MPELVSTLDKSAIETLRKATTCDKSTGKTVADKTELEKLSNGELLNIYRASVIGLDPENPDNSFAETGLINSSIFELVKIVLEGRLADAIKKDRDDLLTEDQNFLLDFGSLTSTDWAKFTRASRIINDGLAYLAQDSFIENARLAKQTKNSKYLKGANKNNTQIFLDGNKLEVSNKDRKQIIKALRGGAKAKNGVTIAAIGDAEILRNQTVNGKSMILVKRTDAVEKSLLIATDKVDFPTDTKAAQFFAMELAGDKLPTVGLPLAHPETSGYMNRLTQMYVKHEKNPLIKKILRKLPVAGTITGIVDATKQFVSGDWFSGTMTLAGEVAKGVMAIPVGIYNLTEIGLHLAGYEITKVFESGWESLKAIYNQTTVDSTSTACEQTVEIKPISCGEKEWSDSYKTFVETCTGDFDGGFQYQGEVSVDSSSRTQVSNNQRRDEFKLTRIDGDSGSRDPFIPKLTTDIGSDELVRLWVAPGGSPTWNFIFYGSAYMEARRRCINKTRSEDDQLSYSQVEQMFLDREKDNRTYVNGVYNGFNDKPPYRIDISTGSTTPIDIIKAEAFRALPATEDWGSSPNYVCTESIYPDSRTYELELVPMAYS